MRGKKGEMRENAGKMRGKYGSVRVNVSKV